MRAVASAIARNHLGYLIPCHRVIRQTGDFNQYRWVLREKWPSLDGKPVGWHSEINNARNRFVMERSISSAFDNPSYCLDQTVDIGYQFTARLPGSFALLQPVFPNRQHGLFQSARAASSGSIIVALVTQGRSRALLANFSVSCTTETPPCC